MNGATRSRPQSSRPTIADLVEALRPVLEVGVPAEGPSSQSAFTSFGRLLGLPPGKSRQEANKLMTELLQDYPDDTLAPAARMLFGNAVGSPELLSERREKAADLVDDVNLSAFQQNTEPFILSTLAFQILRMGWPEQGRQSEWTPSPAWPKVGYLVAITLIILCGFSDSFTSIKFFAALDTRIILATAALVIALVIVAITLRRRRVRERKRRSAQRLSPFPDPAFLDRCQGEGTARLSNSRDSIPLLVEMILSPSQFRMRTAESISLEGRSIKQRVSMDFSFSDARSFLPQYSTQSQTDSEGGSAPGIASNNEKVTISTETRHTGTTPQFLYIPLLMPQKGKLMDRFEISRSDGSSAISLSYQQSLRVLALGLRFLILSALDELGNRTPDLNNSTFETASLVLLSFIGRRGPIRQDSNEWKNVQTIVENTLDTIALEYAPELPGVAAEAERKRRAAAMRQVANYVLMLTHSYPIIVSLPNTDPQPRRRLSFEGVIVSRPQGTSRLRLWLGLRPNYAEIPINLAFETDSHHLEVIGPAEYYVNKQFVGCVKCNKRLRSDWRGFAANTESCGHAPIGFDDQCYIRVRSRIGQNYAHIYMRGFASSRLDYRCMAARVRFAEAPPSVEERALFSAVTASVVFGVLGYILSNFHGTKLPTDVPLVFLALPGAAAAWFGFSSDADTVLRSSLTARISLVVTTLLSLTAVSCYLLQSYLSWTSGPRWSFLGINEYLWLALLGLSLINTIFIGYIAFGRMLLFVWLSTRDNGDSSDTSAKASSNRMEEIDEVLAS